MSECWISYGYPEDGQSHMTLVQWRSRLQRDATEALSVLCRRQESLRERARKETEDFPFEALQKGLRLIGEQVRSAVDGMPRQSGIFSGFDKEEREGAFCKTCLLLDALQHRVAELQLTLTLWADATEKKSYALRAAFLEERQSLFAARQAASELAMQGAKEECAALLDRLDGTERQWSVTLQEQRMRHDCIMSFVCSVTTDFCTRLSAEADLEHDGEAASPTAIVRTLGELRDRTEQLLRSFDRFENTAPAQSDGERK